MNIKNVCSVYFSGTGTTRRVVSYIALETARLLDAKFQTFDFSVPAAREKPLVFTRGELVVFGIFVVAGRVPNLLLPFLNTLQGNGALAIPVVLYGNRGYDDALIELKDILESRGFMPQAAAAFIGEHAFSDKIATGRPDADDMNIADLFAHKIAEKLTDLKKPCKSIQVPGTDFPYRNYYQPLDIEGNPVRFLKAKPITSDSCTDCKLCADICPMGAIDRFDVKNIPGICMKCCACIKKCPAKARHFINEDFLSHTAFLESACTARKAPELFF